MIHARGVGPRGGVVTQRTANPRTPVRFRAWPLQNPRKIERNAAIESGTCNERRASGHNTGTREMYRFAVRSALCNLRIGALSQRPLKVALQEGIMLLCDLHAGVAQPLGDSAEREAFVLQQAAAAGSAQVVPFDIL